MADAHGNVASERSSLNAQKTIKPVEKVSKETPNIKGKQPAKKVSQTTNVVTENSVKSVMEATQRDLLAAITNLQNSIAKQSTRMAEHEKTVSDQNIKITELASKFSLYEHDEELDYEYEEQGEFNYDNFTTLPQSQNECQSELTEKRKSDENNNSRFKEMAKRFKSSVPCDKEIDPVLADNVTELFRQGIDEDRYNELIKDENNGRPSNCEGLVVVATNSLIWEAVSPVARTTDKKMQNVETSVVKAATILTKTVNKMALMESDMNSNVFTELIDECNDTLALLGHSNRQINLIRKDFLRPEINKEYTHLCNHNRPFTNFLFGEDVSKSARELEDCSKISNKLFQNRPYRGGFRRRSGRFPRFRNNYGRGMRGRGQSSLYGDPQPSTSGTMSKNYQRRGARPFHRQ